MCSLVSMTRAVVAVLVFLFVSGPRFRVLDLHQATVLGLGVSFMVWCVVRRHMPNVVWYVSLAHMPIVAYALLTSAWFGGADFTIAWVFLKSALYVAAAAFLFAAYEKVFVDAAARMLVRHTFFAVLVNAGVAVAIGLLPKVRSIATQYLVVDGKEHWFDTGYRTMDLSIGGGAVASLVFATVMVAGIHAGRKWGSTRQIFIGTGVMAVAALLSGRSGSVLIVFGLGLVAVSAMFSSDVRKNGALGLIAMFGLAAAGLTVLIWSSEAPLMMHLRETVLPWALQGILRSDQGVAGNASLATVLQEMYVLPSHDYALLFGTGNAGRSNAMPYIASDVGYVRLIFSVGVLGLLLAVIAYLPFAVAAVRSQVETYGVRFALAFALLVTFAANFKELYVAPRSGAAILAVWYIVINARQSSERR